MWKPLICLCVAVGLAGGAAMAQQAGQKGTGQKGGAGPAEVGYVQLTSQSVPRTANLNGRVVALASAEVRPQVDGMVRSLDFQEGGPVHEGDTLYHLSDDKFRAALAAAKAAVAKANASVAAAQSAFDRAQRLAATNAVSQQALDDAQATLLQAQADVEASKADEQTAQINLDNTTIKAPISGIISTSSVSVGSLVTQNQTTALATIVQIDPINVDLVDSSANLLRIRAEVEAGKLSVPQSGSPDVRLILENGQPYGPKGTVSLSSVMVSESTGTFTVRATFPNSDRILLPGMFVRASVDLGQLSDAFLVPQRAVQRDQTGTAVVFVATGDNKAEQRKITTEGVVGNDWVVTDGVKVGDRLIVDGFTKFTPGANVSPVEVTIGDDGVIRQTLESETASAAPATKPEVKQ